MMLSTVLLLAAAAVARSSDAPARVDDSAAAGGCGWSRCVNCTGGPCGPSSQKCIGKPPGPYTFHLADPSCDINDPNGAAAP